jgi:predicted transcriptional regulator of viral defense system
MNLTVPYYHIKVPADGTQRERLEALLADGTMWRMRDLESLGITGAAVRRAVKAGAIAEVSRGVYRKLGAEHVHGEYLAQLCARVSNAVVCLFSAAEFHGLGNVSPRSIWIAIPNTQTPPKTDWPPYRVVRWRSHAALATGVETHRICGIDVRITNASRTVVDMLRMSSTVGEDRALDCLSAYPRDPQSLAELVAIASELNVSRKLGEYIRAYTHLVRPP